MKIDESDYSIFQTKYLFDSNCGIMFTFIYNLFFFKNLLITILINIKIKINLDDFF